MHSLWSNLQDYYHDASGNVIAYNRYTDRILLPIKKNIEFHEALKYTYQEEQSHRHNLFM